MIDAETSQVINEGEKVQSFVESEDWQKIKKELVARLIDTDSVGNIEAKDPQQVVIEMSAKQMAIDIVLGWVREIEGQAEQSREQNQEFLKRSRDNEYILRQD